MAFWDKWFAPKCAECEVRMTEERKSWEGTQVCAPCHAKLEAAKAAEEKELEERRLAEEAARAKLEGKKAFGGDPRFEQE